MDFDTADIELWSIFPLTDDLSNTIVDPNKLIDTNESKYNTQIGMANFKSIKKPINKQHQQNKTNSNVKNRWINALRKAKLMRDPWSEFHIENYIEEKIIRHRYNAIKKIWVQDECIVKMESKPFANGAMRACFRLKKLSNFSHSTSWENASNYVAKIYMQSDTPRERYFDDVKLQMDAKLWAETYNRHNPPKKVDMFQMSVAEFVNRPNSPIYHLEHYIEGKYIKYNSNSGYVGDDCCRNTPQAFSHFTFECSNHEIIVVDIQGVGDLYTDPQIHTAKGTEYGDGNLGTKGMALFFYSHICNDICRSLGLSQFDLAESELKSNEKCINGFKNVSALTMCRGNEEMVACSPISFCDQYSSFRSRQRYKSQNSIGSSDDNSNSNDLPDIDESEISGYESSSPSPLSPSNTLKIMSNSINIPSNPRLPRYRTQSSCLDSAFSPDDALNYFNATMLQAPRPSCVFDEHATIDEECRSESILGCIHLDLCKYHEMGRFVGENEEFDAQAAIYHLKQAAKLNILEALSNLSKIYLDLPHDILPAYKVPECDENLNIAFDYIYQAADKGDKNSILYIAKAYDTGNGLHTREEINWKISIEWYKKLLKNDDDEKLIEDMGYSDATDEPPYIILARLAQMYHQGGYGLIQNIIEARDFYNLAAEKAMVFGKGRIANKYYMIAEQINAELD